MRSGYIEFAKYEGTGNDFVLLEVAPGSDLRPEWAMRLCDHHRGIGGDGVLLMSPTASNADAGARMIVRNADGSRPEMCGNGARCAALYLARRAAAGSADPVRRVELETDAGLRSCLVEDDPAQAASWSALTDEQWAAGQVTVGMGRVRVIEQVQLAFEGRTYAVMAVDAGNPHGVTFDPMDEATLDGLGAALQRPDFPGSPWRHGVNLERVKLDRGPEGDVLIVDVFERGVGRTLACGTGACAVARAAVQNGIVSSEAPVAVRLPGGLLRITLADDGVRMRGPARRVFEGKVFLPADAFLST